MPPEPFGKPEQGETVLATDPRFRFAWRKPPSGRSDRPLLIGIHGSDRNVLETREAFAALADRCDIAILSPLFPVGAAAPGMGDGYKFLREPGIDYADLLDDMLAAFAEQCPFNVQKIFLFGFSGGAQFALRYGLINASRLAGLVAAAPGCVTLIDDALPWWAGTGGIESATGKPLDRAGLARLPVHLIVGAHDLDEGLVERGPGDPYHSPHADIAGATRRDRLSTLAHNLAGAGIMVTEETVEQAAHDFAPLAAAASRRLGAMMS